MSSDNVKNTKISTLSVIDSALNRYISRMEEEHGNSMFLLDGLEEEGFFAGQDIRTLSDNVLNLCDEMGYDIEKIQSYHLIQLMWLYLLMKMNSSSSDNNHDIFFKKLIQECLSYSNSIKEGENNVDNAETISLDILCFIIDVFIKRKDIKKFTNEGIAYIIAQVFDLLDNVGKETIKDNNICYIPDHITNLYSIETEILVIDSANGNNYTFLSTENFVEDNSFLNIEISSIVGLIIEKNKNNDNMLENENKIRKYNIGILYDTFYTEFNGLLRLMKNSKDMRIYSKFCV